jgi:hypothetical protein
MYQFDWNVLAIFHDLIPRLLLAMPTSWFSPTSLSCEDEATTSATVAATESLKADADVVTMRIVHNKVTYDVTMGKDRTVQELVDHLIPLTRVPAKNMKLMFKGAAVILLVDTR